MTAVVEESEALHRRVRAFALDRLAGRSTDDDFDPLALDIAAFQRRHIAGLARLQARQQPSGFGAASIAAVPVDVFRWTRIAVHEPSRDTARFVTSGTTSDAAGVHPFRTLETYRELALTWGEQALKPVGSRSCTVVALAPRPSAIPTSSLGFMMQVFMEAWDRRNWASGAVDSFDVRRSQRWLLSEGKVDVAGFTRAAAVARDRGEPLIVLSTSFALVFLLEALEGKKAPVPAGSVVMVTGGFKGRAREIALEELVDSVSHALELEPNRIVGEYGMTELSSQLYEGTLPEGRLSGPRGIYLEPPWLRVTPVDPVSMRPVADGEPGLARIVDLANVDSAVAIVTQDRVRRRAGGIELLGRYRGAPLRGCSLAVEDMMLPALEGR